MSFRHGDLSLCAIIDSLKTQKVVKFNFKKIIVFTKNAYSLSGFVIGKDLGYKRSENVKMWKSGKVRNVV